MTIDNMGKKSSLLWASFVLLSLSHPSCHYLIQVLLTSVRLTGNNEKNSTLLWKTVLNKTGLKRRLKIVF